jgi:hypothetical protein
MVSLTARRIATLVINLRLWNCIFYWCVKTKHAHILLLQQPWWTAGTRPELWTRITSVSVVMEIIGPCMEHPLFFGSLCNRECRGIIFPKLIKSAE